MKDYIEREDAAKIICDWCGICPTDRRDIMGCEDICPQFAATPSADVVSREDYNEVIDAKIEEVADHIRSCMIDPGGWIPCSKKLPELSIHESDPHLGEWNNSEPVLICHKDKKFECVHLIALFSDGFSDDYGHQDYGWVEMESADEVENVLAWMPLPEPYKETQI